MEEVGEKRSHFTSIVIRQRILTTLPEYSPTYVSRSQSTSVKYFIYSIKSEGTEKTNKEDVPSSCKGVDRSWKSLG